jgi:hypothetical protein
MNATPPRDRRLLLACLALLALGPGRAAAREPADSDRRAAVREGTHAFRIVLQGLKPLGSVAELNDPARTIVIVLGETAPLADLPDGLEEFVRRGGAVLVATDRALDDRGVRDQLIRTAGVSVNLESVVCRAFHLGARYRDRDFCPYLQPVRGAQPDLFSHPNSPRLHVATNVPSYLRQPRTRLPGEVRPLATLPPGCGFVSGDAGGRFVPTDTDQPLFAVGGDVGDGRILVLADHSIFINEMMLPTDNNNVEFAFNCVSWLADGGRRDRVLFFEEGFVRTDFNVPLRNLRIPPERILAELFARRNEVLAELQGALTRAEEEDVLNRSLLGWFEARGMRPHTVARRALVVLTLLLLLYGAYRVGVRARQRLDPTVPLLARAPPRGRTPGPALPAGNLGASAAHLAREWFVAAGADLGRPPRVLAKGGWWRRLRLRRRVGRLWRLARAAPPRLSPPAFRRLQGELESLQSALAEGSLSLAKG